MIVLYDDQNHFSMCVRACLITVYLRLFTRVTFCDIKLLDMHHSNNHKTIVQSLRIGLPCCQYYLYTTLLYTEPLFIKIPYHTLILTGEIHKCCLDGGHKMSHKKLDGLFKQSQINHYQTALTLFLFLLFCVFFFSVCSFKFVNCKIPCYLYLNKCNMN